jgi:hypothetical protein
MNLGNDMRKQINPTPAPGGEISPSNTCDDPAPAKKFFDGSSMREKNDLSLTRINYFISVSRFPASAPNLSASR